MAPFLRALTASVAFVLAAAPAFAGQRSDALYDPTGTQPSVTPGWSLVPSLLLSRTYDDNVLVSGPGDPKARDTINTINPRGDLMFTGEHAQFSARYDGAFVGYTDLTSLNSYDQHAALSLRRKLSKRTVLFVVGSATAAPTTELLQLTGVPYVRVGVFSDNVRAGIERLMSKRLTMTVEAHFEQARFDETQTFAALLLGGNSMGADIALRQRLSERTTLTADADLQHATIGTAQEQFDIQHAMAGVERRLSEGVRVFASGGISRLGVSSFGPAQTGPAWKVGLSEHYRRTTIDLGFNQSFVPSFGFGGTMQNKDLTARVHVPISRRIYSQGLVSWQQADPLLISLPQLRSEWLEATLGYAVRPWVRIEGYLTGTRQTVGIPDARLTHNQVGFQIIASKPVRIR